MRRALALVAIAVLAGLAAWKLLSTPPSTPPPRTHVPVATAPSGPTLTTAPSSAAIEAAPPTPVEPTPAGPPDDERPAKVHGTVYGEDGEPREAEVQVGADQGRTAVLSVRTSRDGTFSFEVPAGDWSIVAHASGWIAWPERLTVGAGEEYELDILLDRGALVWGWVIGPNASPLPGAVVLCADESEDVYSRTVSDANGQYRFTVPIGWSTVCAESEGLVAAVEPIEPDPGQEIRLDLRLGEPRSLSGRVVDEEGRPVPGAEVTFSRELDSGDLVTHPSWRAESDPQGAFRVERLPQAVLSLTVSARSFLPSEVEGVAPGGEDLVVVLARGARVTGQVLRKSDGAPVESPDVAVIGLGHQGGAEVHSGEQGRFTLTAIPAGTYIAAARAAGFAPGESAPFTVGADGVIEGILVELSSGGTVRGVVLEESSRRPVPQAAVSMMGPSNRARRADFRDVWHSSKSVAADVDGHFEMRLLPPGALEFHVAYRSCPRLRQEVEVIEGGVTEVTFLLQAGGRVEGVLRAVPGGPALATGGRVCLWRERMTIWTAPSEDGRFSLDGLSPGAYRLYAFHHALGRTAVSYQEVEVRGGETARFEVVPGGVGRLSGHVRPPTQASVSLRSRGAHSIVEIVVEADASGAYELVGAPPGEYQVRVSGVTETLTLPEGAYDVRRDFDLPLDGGR